MSHRSSNLKRVLVGRRGLWLSLLGLRLLRLATNGERCDRQEQNCAANGDGPGASVSF